MKKVLCLMLLVFIIIGCNQPPVVTPPPTGTETTTVADATGVLGGFMGTGCFLSKTYIMIDSYWGFVSPFIPASLKGNALPVVNGFRLALVAYDQAVITWYETKAKPGDWDAIVKNVQKAWADVQPLIEQIKQAIANNKPKPTEPAPKSKAWVKADFSINEISTESKSKAITSCPISDLKKYKEDLKLLENLK